VLVLNIELDLKKSFHFEEFWELDETPDVAKPLLGIKSHKDPFGILKPQRISSFLRCLSCSDCEAVWKKANSKKKKMECEAYIWISIWIKRWVICCIFEKYGSKLTTTSHECFLEMLPSAGGRAIVEPRSSSWGLNHVETSLKSGPIFHWKILNESLHLLLPVELYPSLRMSLGRERWSYLEIGSL
jgi:hypothetical protein